MGRTKLIWIAACAVLASCGGEENATFARIGPEGGVLVSADKQLRLELPAGALAKKTTIGIVEVEERAPHGLGKVYRVTPADIALGGPARLVFDKREESEAGVAVASRGADGSWQAQLDSTFSRFDATISVETTEFSTWSLIEMFKLEPAHLRARLGAAKELQVTICLEDYASNFHGALRAKVAEECRPWTLSDRVVRWEVMGVPGGNEEIGTVQGAGSRATYRPPAAMPYFGNPVWVTAILDIPGRPEGGVGIPLTLVQNDCPEGICLIECTLTSDIASQVTPGQVSHQEHGLVFEYDRSEGDDHWFTAIDSATQRIEHPTCTIDLIPNGAAEVQRRGSFKFTGYGDTLTYWGCGGVDYERVERWACEDGWSNEFQNERASLGWCIYGEASAPYDSFSGQMEGLERSWDCAVVR